MCGFAGFVSFADPLEVGERRRILAAMGRAIAHRGPDDDQTYDDGTLSLVYRRLSIIDVDGGRQPIFNETEDKLIVVNGEFYNHAAIRAQLGARHRFATRSDSEVALHLYEDIGPAALGQLRGMFALALWDRSSKELFLARDRFGIKPLYVCRLPHGLLFGSELKALLAHPDCPRDLDWSALEAAGPQQVEPVTTYVKGVQHLAAGEHLIASRDGIRTERYWSIADSLGRAPFGVDAGRYAAEFAGLIESSTTEHLLSDVPIGLHLSGGVDSALIAAIAASRTKDVACFTVVERTSFRAGDVAAAHEVTQALGLPWFPVVFDFRTLLDEIAFDLGRLEQSVYMMDSPRFDPEWIFKEELHRFARRQHPAMKVVLLGQGADEFTGGYSTRIDRRRADWAQYLDEEVRPDLRQHDAHRSGVPARLRELGRSRPPERGTTIGPYHGKMQLLMQQLQHFTLWHEDRTSAFQSLEARVPFLDHRLVELLASIPAALHPELFFNKRILRDTMQRWLPSYDPQRPKVAFFATDDRRSIDVIVHEMVRRIAPEFLDKYLDDPSFPFDPDSVRERVRQVLAREGQFYSDSWDLMELVAIAAFARQCASPNAEDFRARRERRDGPAVLTNERWESVRAAFSASGPGSVGVDWKPADRIDCPAGGEILQVLQGDASRQFILAARGVVCARINVPVDKAWVDTFLRNLSGGLASDFTIADWLDEFEIPVEEFREVVDALYQAGFVRKSPAVSP